MSGGHKFTSRLSRFSIEFSEQYAHARGVGRLSQPLKAVINCILDVRTGQGIGFCVHFDLQIEASWLPCTASTDSLSKPQIGAMVVPNRAVKTHEQST